MIRLSRHQGATFLPAASCSDRKPVECRQGLQAGLHVPEIDLGPEKRDFLIQLAFIDVDVPGPRPAITPITPTVTAPPEQILEVERRLLRPQPHRLLASPLEQDGKRRRAGGRRGRMRHRRLAQMVFCRSIRQQYQRSTAPVFRWVFGMVRPIGCREAGSVREVRARSPHALNTRTFQPSRHCLLCGPR